MTEKKLESALNLAKKGLKIIPVKNNSKIPLLNDWIHKASSDPEQIIQWHYTCSNCNFGIATGDGLVVIDVDNKNGKSGSEVLESLDRLPETFTVATPNGGYHYYYHINKDLKSRNFGNGLELKASGVQVLCPSSTINDVEYKIIKDIEISDFPLSFLEKFDSKKTNKTYSKPVNSILNTESENLENLKSHLEKINPDLEYTDWLATIFAALNIYGSNDDVVNVLKDWSSKGDKYNEKEFIKKIESYKPDNELKLGYPTLKDIQWRNPLKPVDLIKNTFGYAIENSIKDVVLSQLDKYGTRPSKQHAYALNKICEVMAHSVESTQNFRVAFPLETGMGKTTCVIGLALTLQNHDKGLLICTERIEQLVEMKNAMEDAGVDPKKIGLCHSLNDKSIPSIDHETMSDYQILLISHTRLINDTRDGSAHRLLRYKDRSRSLTIWDESLISTSSYYCLLGSIICAIKDWIARYEAMIKDGKKSKNNSDSYEYIYSYFQKLRDILDDADLKDLVTVPKIEYVPNVMQIINCVIDNENYRRELESLMKFIHMGEIRVLNVKGKRCIMQFTQNIDDCFNKIIILDASSSIRNLISYDSSVSIYPLGINKDYSQVEIFHADVRSSKECFKEDKIHINNYLNEFNYLLNEKIPNDEAVIIFCHKDLKEQLVNWKAQYFPLREIFILNWGEHKATNKYSYVKYILTCGILFRNWNEVSSSIIAQTRNLNYSLLDSDINDTYYSEQAEMLYQGISRGNSRNTIDGKAGQQIIYLFHPSEHYSKTITFLRRVMPNMKESKYVTKFLAQGRKNSLGYIELAQLIIDFLVANGSVFQQVSTTYIRKILAPDINSNSKTWRKAISKVGEEMNGWHLNGRNFINLN